jgi:hypothetical protein
VTERELWLLIGPAADRLGISVGKLRKMADQGLIHCMVLPGSGWRKFNVHEIDRMRVLMGLERPPSFDPGVELPEEDNQTSINDYLREPFDARPGKTGRPHL